MNLTSNAQKIYNQVNQEGTKLGDLRKIAKTIKRNHELAMELWNTGDFLPQQLAVLIMDKKELTQELINQLDKDIQNHEYDERNQLTDWLMANQFMKNKKIVALIENWEDSPSNMQRRIFWYYQARLRWTGKIPVDNAESLLASIEKNITKEVPEVQWAMNFTVGQIGIFEAKQRDRCINIGKNTGLYKDEVVHKNCTPNYLPEFIRIQVGKMNK